MKAKEKETFAACCSSPIIYLIAQLLPARKEPLPIKATTQHGYSYTGL